MDMRESIANQTDFSLHLSNRVGSKHAPASNFSFSPLSIHVILSMIAAGSKGRTLDQLTSFLRSGGGKAEDLNSLASQIIAIVLTDGSPVGGPRLSFVGGVWVEQSLSLKPSFEEIVCSTYKAEARAVDFKAKAVEVKGEANSWVEGETGGLIKELLPEGSVDHTTRLVLANALYFKGAWTEKFDASETKESEFHLLDGSSIRAPFMSSKNKHFIRSYDGFKVLRLPYRQGDDKRQFSMYLFLPDQRDGLWNLAEKLGSESGFLDSHLPMQKVAVGEFRIPRFKISFGFEASGVLKELGLSLPFSGEGELTEMVDSAEGKELFVSGIFHKSFVEVNEEGTEAAAASAVVIQQRSLPMGPEDFVADHPFMFLIREDMTGVVVFIGHVLNPMLVG